MRSLHRKNSNPLDVDLHLYGFETRTPSFVPFKFIFFTNRLIVLSLSSTIGQGFDYCTTVSQYSLLEHPERQTFPLPKCKLILSKAEQYALIGLKGGVIKSNFRGQMEPEFGLGRSL